MPVSTRRDVASPLAVAEAQALLAHRALGHMSACTTTAEFVDAVNDLMFAARGISHALAGLARVSDGSERRRAFAAWFGAQAGVVLQHPLQTLHASSTEPPVVYMTRLARGSNAPPIREALGLGRMPDVKPRPEDFFFDGADKQPAIVMCADYLDRVTSLLDLSKQAMKRFGLE